LQKLHALTKDGPRQQDLYTELHFLRDLFYGLYLVSAEDIGLKAVFLPDEPVNPEHCYQVAVKWLPGAFKDPDLGADTRVLVPIYVDPARNVTRVWATLGVRLAKLDADFARPPSQKSRREDRWEVVPDYKLGKSTYLIPVDEFAEVELSGLRMLTRDEFRSACDQGGTKEGIVAALQHHAAAEERRRWWLGAAGGAGLILAVGLVLFFRRRRTRPTWSRCR
jgi:hypothetical protein